MSSITYRPAIDGLRAFAIISVFVFHLNRHWLPGGFVGVDVFFVISGFLITRIITSEFDHGSFSFLRFYRRRVARIFPAFIFCSFCTILAAAFIYTPQDFASTGANLAASALSLSNMKSMLQGNYFLLSEDALPYLHHWTLSVEEQFYMIYPVLVVLALKFRRSWTPAIIALLGIVSFGLEIYLMRKNPIWAFYLLPSRAWELVAGCLLALCHERVGGCLKNPVQGAVQIAGAVGLLLSFILIPEGNAFPGYWAVLPVVSTVAILAASNPSNLIERFLGRKSFVSIGKFSYSLYLWHWPVFSLVDYAMFAGDARWRLALKIVLSLTGAAVSYFLVEKRARLWLSNKVRNVPLYLGLAATVAIGVFVGTSVRKENYINAEVSDVKKGGLTYGPANAKKKIVLIGDSNGSMYGKVIKEIAQEEQDRMILLSVASADPLPASDDRPTFWTDALTTVIKERPSIVILVCRWDQKLKTDPARLEKAITELSPYTEKIVLLTQPPILPPGANRTDIRKDGKFVFNETSGDTETRLRCSEYVKSLQSEKVQVIDVFPYFVNPDHSILFRDEKGRQMYHDPFHLSSFGGEKVSGDLKKAFAIAVN